jgi:hypothetical protein
MHLKMHGIEFIFCQSCLFWLFKLCWLAELGKLGCVSVLGTSPSVLIFNAAVCQQHGLLFIFFFLSD